MGCAAQMFSNLVLHSATLRNVMSEVHRDLYPMVAAGMVHDRLP